MTLAPGAQKSRLIWMAAINAVSVLAAASLFAVYWIHTAEWALVGFIASIVVGLAAQIWFIAGLRVRTNSTISSERDLRTSRRA
jgi:membrane protein YdbS with pleckstrin-like domain